MAIENHSFECKLIPKGNGNYIIPVPNIMSYLIPEKVYEIVMEPIGTLSRINHDSPYSKGYHGSFCGVANVDPKKTISYIEVYAG